MLETEHRAFVLVRQALNQLIPISSLALCFMGALNMLHKLISSEPSSICIPEFTSRKVSEVKERVGV